jgi:hypothetical protein
MSHVLRFFGRLIVFVVSCVYRGANPHAQIQALKHVSVRKVGAGLDHCLALTDEGILYAWGRSGCGQLGLGEAPELEVTSAWGCLSTPTQIRSFPGCEIPPIIVDIACGANHSMAKSVQGTLYTWGNNDGFLRRSFAAGRRVQSGRHIYTPTELAVTAPGVDATMQAIHMTGAEYTTLLLAEERAPEDPPARRVRRRTHGP